MLRLLCLVACFFFVNDVVADAKYIRVTGEGSTVEQAKENAFRTAVQQRAGAIVLSERQANNGKLSKDNISLFSAGYVDDFKIIDINQNGSVIVITMDVLVADSKLLNQVLNSGQTNQSVNGERASVALNTFLDQKEKGDKMLDVVLSTYPQNAFIVDQKVYALTVDSYRNTTFNIPYTMKWNYTFITSMNEAMSLVEDKVGLLGFLQPAPSNVIIMAKNPKDLVIGSRNMYKFNDIPTLHRIKDSMVGDKEVRIMLEISDVNSQLLYQTCYVPDSVNGRKSSFYNIGDTRKLTIYGNEFETGVLKATIDPEHNYIVQRASRIEVSVVPASKCRW
jgi:hypothetical protein